MKSVWSRGDIVGVFAGEFEIGVGFLGICSVLALMRLYYLIRNLGVDDETRFVIQMKGK